MLRGTIDRRILANFRARPEVVARALPAPFRPKVVHGWAVVGICLIRLKHIRPRMVPKAVGIRSENAAHRFAVEWDDNGTLREGVYIPRRDSSSRINSLVGDRLFPGVHHHARFDVTESAEHFRVAAASDDGSMRLLVEGRIADDLPAGSIFRSVKESSEFFERGALGYSATRDPRRFDGLELRTFGWEIEPLHVERVESSYFEDPERFPAGTIEFDSALLMRGLRHEWHGRRPICCAVPAAEAMRTETPRRLSPLS